MYSLACFLLTELFQHLFGILMFIDVFLGPYLTMFVTGWVTESVMLVPHIFTHHVELGTMKMHFSNPLCNLVSQVAP